MRVWVKKLFNDIELRLYWLIVNESWWYVNINVYKMLKKIFLESLLMIDIIYFWNLFYDEIILDVFFFLNFLIVCFI